MAWPAPVCGIVWPSTLELGAGLASPGLAEGEGDADALELGTAEPSGLLLDVEEGDAEGPVDELDEGDGDGVCADADDPSMISEPIIKHATEATASARDSASFRIGVSFPTLTGCPGDGVLCLKCADFCRGPLEEKANNGRQQDVGDIFQTCVFQRVERARR